MKPQHRKKCRFNLRNHCSNESALRMISLTGQLTLSPKYSPLVFQMVTIPMLLESPHCLLAISISSLKRILSTPSSTWQPVRYSVSSHFPIRLPFLRTKYCCFSQLPLRHMLEPLLLCFLPWESTSIWNRVVCAQWWSSSLQGTCSLPDHASILCGSKINQGKQLPVSG